MTVKTTNNRKRPTLDLTHDGALSPQMLKAMEADFNSKPAYKVMQNAVTQVSVNSLANRRTLG